MNQITQQLNTMSAHDAVTAAFAAVDSIQTLPPHHQVAGAAVLFMALCEELKLDVSETFQKAQRMAEHADTHYTTTIRALREYIRKEIPR